jgi:hypothetical protein
MSFMNIVYMKEQLESAGAMRHNEPVSSKSRQKELDLSPPNSGLFFVHFACGELWGVLKSIRAVRRRES